MHCCTDACISCGLHFAHSSRLYIIKHLILSIHLLTHHRLFPLYTSSSNSSCMVDYSYYPTYLTDYFLPLSNSTRLKSVLELSKQFETKILEVTTVKDSLWHWITKNNRQWKNSKCSIQRNTYRIRIVKLVLIEFFFVM